MALTDSERLEVFTSLRAQHGERIAELLMSTIPTFDWSTVATKDDLAQLEARLDRKTSELKAELTKTLYTALIASNAALTAVLALVVTLVAVLV